MGLGMRMSMKTRMRRMKMSDFFASFFLGSVSTGGVLLQEAWFLGWVGPGMGWSWMGWSWMGWS